MGTRESSSPTAPPRPSASFSRRPRSPAAPPSEHQTVIEVAKWATVPVINGLSDYYHPCQALGDLLTMRECFGDLEGLSVAFVGDGNNVARSLAVGCGKLGLKFTLCCPPGYEFDSCASRS